MTQDQGVLILKKNRFKGIGEPYTKTKTQRHKDRSEIHMKTNFIPFYFPQLHSIPENDIWWGKGYTDWDRVKTAAPHSENHYQPRIPLNRNYYDQSLEETQQWQIRLALQYKIYGFNFYHYWFGGKLLLEKPLQNFQKLDHTLKYCITWANETWTKRWEGHLNQVLIRQNHRLDEKEWEAHFNYLLPFFKDKRYITIDQKPVFCIYRPDILTDVHQFIEFFQNQAIKNGLNGIYFIALKAYEPKNKSIYDHFDAIMRFQPRDIFGREDDKKILRKKMELYLRALPERYQIFLSELALKFQTHRGHDYDRFWLRLTDTAKKDMAAAKPIYQSIPVDWDNTPRYGEKSHYFFNYSPEKFKSHVKNLLEMFSNAGQKEIYIFVNAWNEWSEGAYLEPDEQDLFKPLEALQALTGYGGK